MSTAVFLSLPAHGHINPTLPLVTELVRRGERVIYYAQDTFQPAIEHTGATFRSYGADFPIDPIHDRYKFTGNPFQTTEALLDASRWALDHLLQEVKATQPDYIMHDAFCPWGPYLAQILHLPSISSVPTMALNQQIVAGGPLGAFMFIGQLVSGRQYFQRSQALVATLGETFHVKQQRNLFEVLRNYGSLNIVYTSRMFQPYAGSFDDRRYKFVGPSLLPRPEISTLPAEALEKQPLLYISLGTVSNDNAPIFRMCIDAFADSAWQVVMAIGDSVSQESLGAIPANFIVRDFVPQLDVLQRANVFLTHGGMNSVSEALYYHVPMVVIPQSADQPWNARRVAELGAGIALSSKRLSARGLRRAAEDILARPSYAQNAAKIGESLHAAGGYQRAAEEIAAFKRAQGI